MLFLKRELPCCMSHHLNLKSLYMYRLQGNKPRLPGRLKYSNSVCLSVRIGLFQGSQRGYM